MRRSSPSLLSSIEGPPPGRFAANAQAHWEAVRSEVQATYPPPPPEEGEGQSHSAHRPAGKGRHESRRLHALFRGLDRIVNTLTQISH